jgi:L-rhamnose mutarotase
MKGSMRGLAVLGIMLSIGFLTGVACNQAANKPANAADKSGGEPSATKSQPPAESPAAKPAEKVQRFGMAIELKKDKADRYRELHAKPWPEINAMIKKCNIRSYSIYESEIDGKLYLFSYFEYVGDDFKKDMAVMAADPKMKEWWAETDPCQIRLPGTPDGEQWLRMPERYHLD